MKEVLKDIYESMTWMLADIDFRNRENEQIEDSPELKKAKQAYQKLKDYLGE
jgi:hypothetical protein